MKTRRELLPSRYECETTKVKVGNNSWFVNVGFYPDGRVGDINLKTAKAGSDHQQMMHLLGISMSLALQHGATVQELVGLMKDTSENHVMRAIATVLEGAR